MSNLRSGINKEGTKYLGYHDGILRMEFDVKIGENYYEGCGIYRTFMLDGTVDEVDTESFQISNKDINEIQETEDGIRIGYKKLRDDRIAKLQILGEHNQTREVINARFAKYKCSEAKVISITSLDGTENHQNGFSLHDEEFEYKVGEIVKPKHDNITYSEVCGSGIHYFILRTSAMLYNVDSFEIYDDGYLRREYITNGEYSKRISRHPDGTIKTVSYYKNHRTYAIYDYYYGTWMANPMTVNLYKC